MKTEDDDKKKPLRRSSAKPAGSVQASVSQTSWSELTDEDSLDVLLPSTGKPSLVTSSTLKPAELDLTGLVKVVVLPGRGGNGKSVVFRVLGESSLDTPGRDTILAAGDLGNRSSKQYFEEIEEPTGNGVAATADLLIRVIKTAASNKWNALVDLGAGGELALIKLHKERGLLQVCKSLGVELVVLHVMTASVDNVSVFASLEREGSQPRATALIFNEAGLPDDSPREVAFELISKQVSIRAAVKRKVPQLWLPSLPRSIITEIEGRRLLFGDAAAGKVGPNKKLGAIDPFDCIAVADWLAKVRNELSPIHSWLSNDDVVE